MDIKNFFAKNFVRLIPRQKLIGVLGSIGKTTTLICIKKVLEERMKVVSSADGLYEQSSSLNKNGSFEPSVSAILLKMSPKVQKVIIELSCKTNSDSGKNLNLFKPPTVVLTNLEDTGRSDLDRCTVQLAEKAVEEVPKDGYVVLNWEDSYLKKLTGKSEGTTILYGFDKENCDVWAGNLRVDNYQTVFELNYGVERVEVNSKLIGYHQVLSMLAAAAVGVSLNIPLITIKKGLEKVEPLPNRLLLQDGHNSSLVLDDSYDSDPLSLDLAIEALNRMTARRRILVLGEMRGLGDQSEKLHKLVARRIYTDKIDLILTGTGDAGLINDELEKLGFMPERMEKNLQNPQLVSKLLKIVAKGDVVLVKGSSGSKFYDITRKIAKKQSRY